MWVNSINLIPNYHSGFTRYNAHHRIRDCLHHWVNFHWKRKPSPLYRKARWIWWLYQVPKAVCLTILIKWLRDSCLSSISYSPLKAGGAATQFSPVWAINQHHEALRLPWVCSKELQWWKPKQLSSHLFKLWPHQKEKVNTNIKYQWEAQLWKRRTQLRTQGIIDTRIHLWRVHGISLSDNRPAVLWTYLSMILLQ